MPTTSDHSFDNFVILLKDLEKWVSEEAYAIRKGDLNYLEEILPQKASGLEYIVAAKEKLTTPLEAYPDLEERVKQLKIDQAENQSQLSQLIAQNRTEKQDQNLGVVRLKNVGGTYGRSAYTQSRRQPVRSSYEA